MSSLFDLFPRPPRLSQASRYRDVETTTRTTPGGEVTYLRRRFIPAPHTLARIGAVVVQPDDRPDRLAYRAYGDAERAWQLADANGAMDLDELVREPGRVLVVATKDPEGR